MGRPRGRKMEVCGSPHLRGHRDETSSAHVLPYRDFLEELAARAPTSDVALIDGADAAWAVCGAVRCHGSFKLS